jgi:hypothetical protein
MDQKIAHLGFVQGVINRMGMNSFLLKGWSVTLLAATLAISAKDANKLFLLIAYFPLAIFWALDSYYLHQEKLFRELYKSIANGETSSEAFTMETKSFIDKVPPIGSVALSHTIAPIYVLMAILILLAFFGGNTLLNICKNIVG